ncbi:hypothetical protein FJ960_01900 [Mesorhizobium sp. B2-3-11]|uniref:hypothetical protein n=1 Tax=Mesorhizobium sp. B2-3-11 TaxID=2589953 RepID=UPI001128FEEE|nr:hypothetical protein [Mesorhizobium sp. B2-3-11]TPM11520.1 hypothetical protein FJ960_01900 [Mesorhizobium sp. B2-3-11]
MFKVNKLIGFAARRTAAAAGLQYVATDSKTAATTNPSWTGVSFGPTDATREIFVLVGMANTGGGAALPTAFSIDGATTTLVGSFAGASVNARVAIYRAAPSGTTGTISYTSAANLHTIAVYQVAGGVITVEDVDGRGSSSNEVASVTIDSAIDDVVLAISARRTTGADISGVTVDYSLSTGILSSKQGSKRADTTTTTVSYTEAGFTAHAIMAVSLKKT